MRNVPILLGLALGLAACGQSDERGEAEGLDPAITQPLGDELASDPDLSGRNEAAAALSGTANDAIPTIDTSRAAIDAARTRALEMVGGVGALKPLGEPHRLTGSGSATPAMKAAAQAVVAPGGANCADKVSYTTGWAAKLPAEFPVYPRGNTAEAAGTDEGACALRAVTFRTPVPIDDVLAFYATRAKAAGYGVDHAIAGGEHILSGQRGTAAYVVYARAMSSTVNEIDLVTSGK